MILELRSRRDPLRLVCRSRGGRELVATDFDTGLVFLVLEDVQRPNLGVPLVDDFLGKAGRVVSEDSR